MTKPTAGQDESQQQDKMTKPTVGQDDKANSRTRWQSQQQDKMTKPTVGQDDKANSGTRWQSQHNSTYSSITAPLKTTSKQHPKLCQNSTQNSFRTLLKPIQNTTQNSLEFHPEHHQTTTQTTIRPPPRTPSDHHQSIRPPPRTLSSDPPNPIRRNGQSFVRTCQRGFVGRRRKTGVAVLYLHSQSGPGFGRSGQCFAENETPYYCDFW